MLEDARRYLLSVGVFGWDDFDKKPSPFFDETQFGRACRSHYFGGLLSTTQRTYPYLNPENGQPFPWVAGGFKR